MSYKTRWRLFWGLGWLGLFAVGETIAHYDPRRGDTLSEQAWSLVSMPLGAWIFAPCFIGLFIWLTFHFLGKAKWK